jgi:hypothetical protein
MVIETAEPDRTAALVPPPADTCVTLAPASPPPAGTGEFRWVLVPSPSSPY